MPAIRGGHDSLFGVSQGYNAPFGLDNAIADYNSANSSSDVNAVRIEIAKGVGGMVPVVGELIAAKEFVDEPSLINGIWAAASIIPAGRSAKAVRVIEESKLLKGVLQKHHLITKQSFADPFVGPILKELGYTRDTADNMMLALQRGGTAAHRKYNFDQLQLLTDIVKDYKAGKMSKSRAQAEIDKIRQEARDMLDKEPNSLLHGSSEPGDKRPER